MKAIVILLAIIAVLYSMKVISFDLPLLEKKYNQFTYWCKNIYLKIKSGFDKFIDWFNKITGNENS
jgi:hypothetical protein